LTDFQEIVKYWIS